MGTHVEVRHSFRSFDQFASLYERFFSFINIFFFFLFFLPFNADFCIAASVDRACRHIPVVTVAGICVQRQYVVAVDVTDDRRQHSGARIQ